MKNKIERYKRFPMGLPVIDRIMDSIVCEPSGCWRWIRPLDKFGYGQLNLGNDNRHAHRRVYEFFMGVKVPGKMHVDHLCKNRACVNFTHMEVVSSVENHRRSRVAKLNLTKAREIRSLYKKGMKQGDIAKMFGLISSSTISYVVNNHTWREGG